MNKKIWAFLLAILIGMSTIVIPQVGMAQEVSVTNDPHTGAGVLQIQTEGKESWGVYGLGLRNIKKNVEYKLSYWVKGDSNVSAAVRVVVNSNWSIVLKNTTITATEEWTQQSITFNSGNNTNLTFAIMDNSVTAGYLYFDDFSIERLDGIASSVGISDPGFENTVSSGAYGSVLYFENKVVLEKNGETINKLEAGDLKISLDFRNLAGVFPTANIVVALFRGNRCLRTVVGKTETEIEKNQTVPLSVHIQVEESEVKSGAYLNVMLWNSEEEISPLCKGKTIINSSGIQHGLFFKDYIGREPVSYHRGVNLAGAEFGGMSLYNRESDFKYFAEKGFDILRVPVKWERMQPTLFGELDANEIKNLKNNADWAQKYGAQIIVDVHNYSKYGNQYIGMSDTVTMEAYNDLWRRLSDVFKEHQGVYGYDIMNEPSGSMKADTWKKVSQSCVDAIRANNDNKLILVEGVSYSSAGGWANNNQAVHGPWINDPIDNIMYSAHCYFDSDNSGTYKKTLEEEMNGKGVESVINRALGRLTNFTDWCQKYGVRGHLGEFGIPGRAEDDDRWLEVLEAFLQKCDETGMDTTYWAAGRYWGDYALSCQPTDNYTKDAKQMQVLLRHMPKK